MNSRGQYGNRSFAIHDRRGVQVGGGSNDCGSSLGTWVLGAIAVGGAVLWARHQSAQLSRVSQASGVPYESFTSHVRGEARQFASTTRSKIHEITRPRSESAA